MDSQFILHKRPGIRNPALVVAWVYNSVGLAARVIDFLDKAFRVEAFGEIKLPEFFSLGGVDIENDVISFPESRFYACQAKKFIIFESDAPSQEHYAFLNTVLDFSIDQCRVKKLYTIGERISPISNTMPRNVFSLTTQPKMKKKLAKYGVDTSMNYQSNPGGSPSLNTFLLWMAKRRGIDGCGFWVDVPFYLTEVGDPQATKAILEVLDQIFKLNLDFRELDQEIAKLNRDMGYLRKHYPEIDGAIDRLEQGRPVADVEGRAMAKKVAELLRTSH